jgi:hypothetical protein
MEPSNGKYTRLRLELQQAYDAWIDASEREACGTSPDAAIDVSGIADAAKLQWFAYLAAKDRLVLAYAERLLAA